MSKPKILYRGVSNVKISWDGVLPASSDVAFVLELLDPIKSWIPAFWGYKTVCNVENLHPCTCYNFRLRCENQSDWLYFKAATDIEPFLTRHMTRAVKFGKVSQLRKLIQARPILLELENSDFQTPLMQASSSGDLNTAVILVNMGANVNAEANHTKKTALLHAILNGHLKLAEFLVDKGANVHCKDNNDCNILHYAVNANNLEGVKFCLQQRLDINCKDNKGYTPLIRASFMDVDESLITFLLDSGADPSLTDRAGFDFEKHCMMSYRENLSKLIRHDSRLPNKIMGTPCPKHSRLVA